MALTVKKIEKLSQPGRYGDGHGLYLQVLGPNNKSWLFRYERALKDESGETVRKPNGRAKTRERWMGLGPLHTFDLPEARDRARDMRKLLADGIDPLEAKRGEQNERARQAARRKTFKEAAQAYFEKQEGRWSNPKHRAQFLSTLETYAFSHIGELPVDTITTEDVLRVFNAPIAPRRGAPADAKPQRFWLARPETARRVRTRIEAVLDWAALRGYRQGENPARWSGHLKHELPQQGDVDEHHPALPWAKIAGFMAQLEGREGVAAKALQLLILAAARTSEITGAAWDEFDLKAGTWTIPRARMKAGRDHVVPLSPKALALLNDLPREGRWVFPGGKEGEPLSNMAMATVLRRMGYRDITVHGFRSTFRDWAAERTNYPNHVVEMALAHAIGSKVEKAYRRGQLFDWRKRLMNDWATFCLTPMPADRGANNVVAMGAGR